jgi:hypothetical protein
MTFTYHPDALTEYADAALYYDERLPGLGADFTAEVDRAIERVHWDPRTQGQRDFMMRDYTNLVRMSVER